MAPIVGADQFKIQLRNVARIMSEERSRETRFHFFGMSSIVPMTISPRIIDWKSWSKSALEISNQFLRGGFGGGSFHPEEVVNLTDEDDEGYARCKTADDGRGDEGDEATEAQETDDQQEQAREQTRDPDALRPYR